MAPLGVGDCIAIADLLIKAVKVLKESGGASEEYQDVEEHAIALNVGLGHLRTLEQDPAHQTPAAFSQALSLCEKSLQQLCQKKAKYEPSLGKHAKINKLSGAFRKMQWALLHSKDTKDLRAALSSEIISAVLVLQAQLMEWSTKPTHESAGMRTLIESLIVKQEAGFDSLAAKIERLGLDNESRITNATNSLTQKITSTESAIIGCCRPTSRLCLGVPSNASRNADELLKSALASFESSMESQMQRLMRSIYIDLAQAKNTEQSPAKNPHQDTNVTSHVATLRHGILPLHRSVETCVKTSTQVIQLAAYMLVDALRCFWIYFKTLVPVLIQAFALFRRSNSLSRQPILSPHDSVTVFDALGRTLHLPYIFVQDYDALTRGLRAAFINCPGQEKVNHGYYVFHNMLNRQAVKKSSWNQTVFPGAKVAMSILITEFTAEIGYCPRRTCQYPFKHQTDSNSAFFQCPKCQIQFGVSEMSKTQQDFPPQPGHGNNDIVRNPSLDDISKFKRVQIFQGLGQFRKESPTGVSWEEDQRPVNGYYCGKCGFGPMLHALHPICIKCGELADSDACGIRI